MRISNGEIVLMPIYKSPEEKAVETVTIRLTNNERRLLNYLAQLESVTITDFLRMLIVKRADELKVTELPPPTVRRRPGRPKKLKDETAKDKTAPSHLRVPIPSIGISPEVLHQEQSSFFHNDESIEQSYKNDLFVDRIVETHAETQKTFRDLAVGFKESFIHRAEGTKRELEEAIQFLCTDHGYGAIISPNLPIHEITSDTLKEVRNNIRDSNVRLAKKNLFLTYLRMMLHFGVKEADFELRINPSKELPPLQISESNDSMLFFVGPSESKKI